MRLAATLTIVGALAALVVVPSAAAHGGGGARGFTSTVTTVAPPVAGVTVTVLQGDDRLLLRNDTGATVTILGYEGEPYLELRADGVFQNRRSPATYLNEERLGNVELPPTADAEAAPDWEKVSPRSAFEWHDHRIHWMSETLPPAVAAAKDESHHVFDWKVPAKVAGKPFTIEGSLDYAPLPGQSFPKPLLVPLVLLALAAVTIVVVRRRRRLGD